MTEQEKKLRGEAVEQLTTEIMSAARERARAARPPGTPVELADVVWAVASVIVELTDMAVDVAVKEANANILTAVKATAAVAKGATVKAAIESATKKPDEAPVVKK
jgi:hypothetical protein